MINYHQRPLRFFASLGRPLERFFTDIVKVQDRQTREAHLWMEAEERLAQLDFLVSRSEQLQHQHGNVWRAMIDASRRAREESGGDRAQLLTSPALDESNRLVTLDRGLLFELKLSTEAFYYFAARFIRILNCFPQLKSFDVPGIRNVRNHLIEHSENASGVTQQDWGYSPETGPALKSAAARPPGKEHVRTDAGLFVNAAELRDRLERRLEELLISVT